MVDDNEFVKRRHLSRGRPRKYEPPSSPPGDEQSNPTNQSSNSSQAPNMHNSADPQQSTHTDTGFRLASYNSPANSNNTTPCPMSHGNDGDLLGTGQNSCSSAGVAQ